MKSFHGSVGNCRRFRTRDCSRVRECIHCDRCGGQAIHDQAITRSRVFAIDDDVRQSGRRTTVVEVNQIVARTA